MAVKSLGNYNFAPKDTVDKFPAPLLYIGWEDHKMLCNPYCVPMPSATKFGELVQGVLPGMYGVHPDFAHIEWDKAEWFMSGKPFTPDMDKTLAEHGIGHKSVIRFRTPGLTGLAGSCF
ncbi:MAG: phenol hydroxylase subunit P4 [Proteobacteria bacterium]|nr:phenol hydroxylase subunit P4 [Pseudomonadota bacterium]MBS0494077.1 phenol hydroxylase subunit P4 [Pseudomonadota bacterium]